MLKASLSRYTHNVGPDGFQQANPASGQFVIFQFMDPNGKRHL